MRLPGNKVVINGGRLQGSRLDVEMGTGIPI